MMHLSNLRDKRAHMHALTVTHSQTWCVLDAGNGLVHHAWAMHFNDDAWHPETAGSVCAMSATQSSKTATSLRPSLRLKGSRK